MISLRPAALAAGPSCLFLQAGTCSNIVHTGFLGRGGEHPDSIGMAYVSSRLTASLQRLEAVLDPEIHGGTIHAARPIR